ncbi:unnamed protein product [Protopolystoma xenopodis]|uniref:Uncharacterized protein n=1 Tax=Protopolystoma xenopodis TaxID=117903 RepID=A0A448XBA6_9PLAT|nr:unnamed protein product [Protopolystoma xenopodis]
MQASEKKSISYLPNTDHTISLQIKTVNSQVSCTIGRNRTDCPHVKRVPGVPIRLDSLRLCRHKDTVPRTPDAGFVRKEIPVNRSNKSTVLSCKRGRNAIISAVATEL